MATVQLKQFLPVRVRRCRALLKEKHFAGIIVSDSANIQYLTGFTGEDSMLILTDKAKILVTDSRFTLQARQECGRIKLHIRKGPLSEAVACELDKLGLIPRDKRKSKKSAQIAVEAEHLSLAQHRSLHQRIGNGLTETMGLVGTLRLCKDDYELKQLKKAIQIAQQAMSAILPEIKPGVSETALAARLDYEMRCRGALGSAFPTIAAVGEHAAQPHAVPNQTRVKKNGTILFDWGANWGGYRSDLTRCFVTGRIHRDFAAAYEGCLNAQLAAIQAVKPGATLAEVDAAARIEIPRKMPMYGHGTGHGIGLDIHEAPGVSSRSQGVLKPGMVITVEPGIYVPGQFGIRIEDDVLVTETGHRVLSSFPKALDDIIR